MKEFLQKWLGIDEVSEKHKQKIREEVSLSVREIFRSSIEFERRFWGRVEYSELRGLFRLQLESVIRQESGFMMKQFLHGIIDEEKFIDDIVKRIKDKQLPRK